MRPDFSLNRDPNRDKTLCDSTSNGTGNVKTVPQTSLLHIESSLDRLGLLSLTHDQRSQQQSGQITLQPASINKFKFLKASHRTKMRKIERPRSMAREPAFSRPKSCTSLGKKHESCPFAAPFGLRSKKNYRGQTSVFPSETSRFTPLVLAPRDSALPWLVDDRAALHLLRRIWCVPTR